MSQSQSSDAEFLEQISRWDKKTCEENLDDALPKIISKLEESAYIQESIGILKIICQSFLPCVPSEELEDRVFSQICQLTCGFMDSSLNKIQLNVKGLLKDTTEEVKSVVVECLEWMMDILICVETCIKHVLTEARSVELSSVQSLPGCAVQVLKQAYTHCRDSSGLYGDLLERIGDTLSVMFKKAHALQMSFLNLLDKICITGAQLETHVHILCSVCSGLFEICGIVTNLDVKLVISLWKAIAKVCSQHLNLLRDRFDVCPLIRFLCGEIQQGFKYLFQLYPGADSDSLSQGDDQAFSKSVKILGFQMKVLVALLRDFQNYLGNCEENVLSLLITLHRHLPPSLCASKLPDKQESELRTQLLSATAPIIGHLMDNRVFRTGLASGLEERPTEDRLPLLLIQLMVLDVLPKFEIDVIGHWLTPVNHNDATPTKGLLSAIFQSVALCEVEMRVPVMLPSVMVAGKPQRQVNLYEHVATHICGYIGACQACHFHNLEATLLENLGAENTLCYLMAMDCWCFLARYGTAELCRDHVRLLTQVYRQLMVDQIPAQCNIRFRLRCFIPRLIRFMSAEHQGALVKLFPPEKEPELWVTLTPNCLSNELAKCVAEKLIAWALSVLRGTQAKTTQIFLACDLLTEILSKGSVTADCLTLQQRASVLDNVCAMWKHIHGTLEDKRPVRAQLVSRLLPVTKHFLPTMETKYILKVLICVQSFLKSEDNEDVALSTAKFLSGSAQLKISPSFEQSQVLNRLPQVFHEVLTHPHPLIHLRAMISFSEFASYTVHEETIPACVQGNQELQDRVEKFLNKKPYVPPEEFDVVEFLRNQISVREKAKAMEKGDESGSSKMEVDEPRARGDQAAGSSTERPAKRARVTDERTETSATSSAQNMDTESALISSSTSTTSKYQTFMDTLTSVAGDLELECTRSAPPPKWFVDAAKLAVTRINDCIVPSNNWFDSLQ